MCVVLAVCDCDCCPVLVRGMCVVLAVFVTAVQFECTVCVLCLQSVTVTAVQFECAVCVLCLQSL